MKSLIFLSLSLLISGYSSYSQVGINTSGPNPNSSLDVNGGVVIREFLRSSAGTSGLKLVLVESDGMLIQSSIGSEMLTVDSENNVTIKESGISYKEKVAIQNPSFDTKTNYNPFFGNNVDVTVLILRRGSGGDELKIRGMVGGYEGRRLRIINDSGEKIKFEEDHTSADPENRIYIYTKENELKHYGSCELIYSETVAADGTGRWCILFS